MSHQSQATTNRRQWQFWIDRGGTFTDVVALAPDGAIVTDKLLSENPRQYRDAAIEGIRRIVQQHASVDQLEQPFIIKMGTTVATNALLERKGDPTLLVITRGFADALRIGYQNRPELFQLQIELPQMLYQSVLEVKERVSADGQCLTVLDETTARQGLQQAYAEGIRAVGIVLMHAYRYPAHEQRLAQLATEIGFEQISCSHRVSPLMKLVSRGDTTVVDAYLSPILRRYVNQVADELQAINPAANQLQFMQSSGGLTEAHRFAGKDAILSGPAGGVVGMVETATAAGFDKLIGFDMGGTSTDVCHYAGEFERAFDTEVAGVRMRAPMMRIHTVAAGGGSILQFDGARNRVGPESAGANPGPASYGNQGPLCVTDCNVMLGRIQADYFPRVFGANADQPLDVAVVRDKFAQMAQQIVQATGKDQSEVEIASGFLAIAVENMANAIKRISVQRGYDIAEYTLCCFGGAGGQHACLVADALAIKRVFLHPFAGVLSAYGMGLADLRQIHERSVEQLLEQALMPELRQIRDQLTRQGEQDLLQQGARPEQLTAEARVHCRYQGSDTNLAVTLSDLSEVVSAFERQHRQSFGFIARDKAIIVQALEVEVIAINPPPELAPETHANRQLQALARHPVVLAGQALDTPFYQREQLPAGQWIDGPAVIIETTGTIVIEPGWRGQLTEDNNIVLERYLAQPKRVAVGTDVDPVMLEIFNNLFMSIAEQMGSVLENTAVSVNIKERLDFSCAVFDADGDLIANAPHMPVHLGSMSESIKTVIRERRGGMRRGDAYVLNAPYNGGTHLPDVTIIKPVFDDSAEQVIFYVAARGHHADIGGKTPGSMPADSTDVSQEGVLLDNQLIVDAGVFKEDDIRALLAAEPFPARNIDTNIADFKAQLAACEKGMQELLKMVEHFSLPVVHAYMQHVQNNAEESVRRVLDVLSDGAFSYAMDDGSMIRVRISLDKQARSASIDFSGTSPQHARNFNAPSAIARAAVLYVFRCLVNDQIPLNEGCLKPLKIILPEHSMICPEYPAAVVAGNVETSQAIVDTLLGALGVTAASQGTMNNVTWGNANYQYYETLCGGEGASDGHHGCDAVHTHMTNSRLTDPEVLEFRFPVVLESFAIRRGSGGAGQFQGGDGVIRRLRFNEAMSVSLLTGHRQVPPYGASGGAAGQTGSNRVERKDGSSLSLGSTDSVEVDAGDALIIETPGGGGWGEPDA
ncbi:MAG: hydantoinase B/oxoprolinase family protein [Gammaproteobacteria bacterium]|nr:hydantoinase B/oxoprolinase family protein [Gammaproteobacteria bacterium]